MGSQRPSFRYIIYSEDARTSSQRHQCWSREPPRHLLTPGGGQRRGRQTEEGGIIRSCEDHQGRGHLLGGHVEVLHGRFTRHQGWPRAVLVMSLLFIACVFMLHIWGKYNR